MISSHYHVVAGISNDYRLPEKVMDAIMGDNLRDAYAY